MVGSSNTTVDSAMNCPNCASRMLDVTESWHTFAAAQGAEYLAAYVTIWHCDACQTLAGAGKIGVEWVLEPDEPSVPAPPRPTP